MCNQVLIRGGADVLISNLYVDYVYVLLGVGFS